VVDSHALSVDNGRRAGTIRLVMEQVQSTVLPEVHSIWTGDTEGMMKKVTNEYSQAVAGATGEGSRETLEA